MQSCDNTPHAIDKKIHNSDQRQKQSQDNHSEIMTRVSRELLQAIQANYDIEQKTKLLHSLEKIKKDHATQIQSLRLKQHLQQSTYNFTLQQQKNKYDQLSHDRDCLAFQNQKLRNEMNKYKQQLNKMYSIVNKYQHKIKNQQSLIDQYKNSIEEQISLQKQVIRAGFMEKELNQKIQFEKALKSMEENYQRKLSQLKQNLAISEFNNDVKTVKKFCTTLGNRKNKKSLMDAFQTSNKQNYHISSTKKLAGSSSYSTIQK